MGMNGTNTALALEASTAFEGWALFFGFGIDRTGRETFAACTLCSVWFPFDRLAGML